MPTPGEAPPTWMIELAEQVGMIEPGALALLPRGVIVGSALYEGRFDVATAIAAVGSAGRRTI